MHINELTYNILKAGFRIHTQLGPGLYESVYEAVMERDLIRQGFDVQRQKRVGFEFEGMKLEPGYRVDLLVNRIVVVEINRCTRLTRCLANNY